MKKIIFFILVISTILLLNSCISKPKDGSLLKNKLIYGNFDKELIFSENISKITIDGQTIINQDKNNRIIISKDFFKNSDNSIKIKYETIYGRIYEENIPIIHPDLQIFFYAGGETSGGSLGNFIPNDIQEMKDGIIKSSKIISINIVADYNDSPDKIISINNVNGLISQTINFPQEYGLDEELKVSDPEILNFFMDELIDKNNSSKLFMILWNHGSGWIGEGTKRYHYLNNNYSSKSIIIEDNANYLRINELKNSLYLFNSKYNKIPDIIGFDACNMSMIEIIYELSDYTDYLVSSVNLIPGTGWNYKFLSKYDDNIDVLLQNLVQYYKETYENKDNIPYKTSLTALKTNGLKLELDNFFKNYVSSSSDKEFKTYYTFGNYNSIKNTDINQTGFKIEDYILSSYVEDNPNLSGIGLALKVPSSYKEDYEALTFYKNKLWNPVFE
ncbi:MULTISPECIES: clostripain-related cysteine peptidase [Oceanotoga]|uniref:clostripain-related cysteine peptidase n=1 Tax=Oceanotoga TaxID=1255275 RepID=UPI00265301DF|nr:MULTISPECIES: clostripain-related cysteine peptidase [Oceanotoga]MDN5343278.1 hypothetical protein [Oceanotoga sp.]MDO7977410.1 clostripain-related cysteine peptidase [Oceanotoga teriensis]